jgi:hypothetical protein
MTGQFHNLDATRQYLEGDLAKKFPDLMPGGKMDEAAMAPGPPSLREKPFGLPAGLPLWPGWNGRPLCALDNASLNGR